MSTETELKIISTPEIQAKYDSEISSGNIDFLLNECWGLNNWKVEYKGVKSVTDEYWDTPDLDLHQLGGSFRVRYKDGAMSVDIKEVEKGRTHDGLFSRKETIIPIDVRSRGAYLTEKFASLRREHFPLLASYDFHLVFRLQNYRRVYILSNEGAEVELSIDSFNYTNLYTGQVSHSCGEIEFEAMNPLGEVAVKKIAQSIVLAPGFSPSQSSKYSRGVMELKLEHPAWFRRITSWWVSPTGATLGAFLTIGGFLLGVIGLLLTIFK
jgi:inorganic triphosphatase YgiF